MEYKVLQEPHSCSFCRDLLQGLKFQSVKGNSEDWCLHQDVVILNDFATFKNDLSTIKDPFTDAKTDTESDEQVVTKQDISSADEKEARSCALIQHLIKRSHEIRKPTPEHTLTGQAGDGRGPVTKPQRENYNNLLLRICWERRVLTVLENPKYTKQVSYNAAVWFQGRIIESFNVYRPRGSPLPLAWLREEPNRDIASQEMLNKVRDWAQNCHRWHVATCPVLLTPKMPHRVLELEPNGMRLIETTSKTKKSLYAALSYCWGDFNPVKLTKLSREGLLHSINEEILPKTMRDAIYVTRQLKLRYLWVDALCIMQDEEDDQDREISEMPGIYKNAYVTISAATAQTSDSGFLEKRGLPPSVLRFAMRYPPQTEEETFQSSQGDGWPMFILDTMYYPTVIDEPLHSRAWALQETMLSPRIVSFGHRQIEYRCVNHTQTDGGYFDALVDRLNLPISNVRFKMDDETDLATRMIIPTVVEPTLKTASFAYRAVSSVIPDVVSEQFSKYPMERSWSKLKPVISGDPNYWKWGINVEGVEKSRGARRSYVKGFVLNSSQVLGLENWITIVETYTKRHLSDPNDRLRAIAAIAQEMQRLGDEGIYLAGLWPIWLPTQLCWERVAYVNDGDEVAAKLLGPSSNVSSNLIISQSEHEYRAPSWSWASVDGPVLFMADPETEVEGMGGLKSFLDKVEILEYSVNPESKLTTYFKFSSGFLRLRGRLQTIKISQIGMIFLETSAVVSPLVSNKTSRQSTWSTGSKDRAIFDRPEYAPTDVEKFTCLEILIRPNGVLFALILKEVPEKKDTYRRIGLAVIEYRTGLFDEDRELVTIMLI